MCIMTWQLLIDNCMVFEDLFAPYFLPVHHPSSEISSCPKRVFSSKLLSIERFLIQNSEPGLYAGSNYCQSHVLVDMWMLSVKLVYKLSNCAWWPEMGCKHTFDTFYTHFQGITNNIYGFGRPFFCSFLFLPVHNPSSVFLPVHIRFYPSKWWVDGSLDKAMLRAVFSCASRKSGGLRKINGSLSLV